MSTKTTFKRIALVAVAALTLGSFSAVSATAAPLANGVVLPTVAAVSAPATGTTSVAVTGIFMHNGLTNGYGATTISTTANIVAAPTTSTLAPNAPLATLYTGTAYTGTTGVTTTITNNNTWGDSNDYNTVAKSVIDTPPAANTSATARITAYFNVTFTPDKAGKYVIAVKNQQDSTQIATWTVDVVDPTQKSATAFLNTDSATASSVDATSLVFTSTSSATPKGRLTVRQYSTTDTATLTTAAISQSVVVAITKGLVSKTNDFSQGAKSVTTAAATAATNDYYVYANGEVGSADLTVTVGGTLVSTKKITFSGAATAISAAVTTGQPTWIAPAGTTTLTVKATDSAGNAATALPTLTATSATTTVATVAYAAGVVTITGVAAGTSVITIADSATTAPVASVTYTVTVAPAVSATLPTITFDKAEYSAGELMTITIAAAAADNASFAAFSAAPIASTNLITVKNPFTGGAVALVSGKATWTAYAPITAGPVTISATSSTGSSATAAAVTATATVLSDGVAQAAADAAAEAIDAANAATDAANAAAEAADAATAAAQDAADAVAALAVQVTEQVAELKAQNDALRKQLIALTNLIIKIQKKVKA
jgi:hypothetical protein